MAKASTLLATAKSWLGKNEADGSHRQIIDLYNSHKPLARGYAVKYTDAWCATFVSAVAIKCNATDIIPIECSCNKMIELAKKKGIWVEDENRTPKPGDLCLYDWEDNKTNFGITDNKGQSDHVGIVEVVTNGRITVIEGNKNNSVERRVIDINGRYIRGFIVPRYEAETSTTTTTSATKEVDTAKVIWDYLMQRLNNAYGVAGLMGNLYAESGLSSINLQNSGNRKLNMTDIEYTNAVDNGTYTNFIKDSIGYGLAQWTFWTRKKALLEFAKSKKASIGSLEMQLDFLLQELSGYKSVNNVIKTAKTVREASDAVLTGYEKPADMSDAVKVKRASFGQKYYDLYAKTTTTTSTTTTTKPVESSTTVVKKKEAKESASRFDRAVAGTYKVTAKSGLHLRDGAGTVKHSMVVLPYNTEVKNYGYYTPVLGTNWLYIQTTLNGVQYTGFASSKYLQK